MNRLPTVLVLALATAAAAAAAPVSAQYRGERHAGPGPRWDTARVVNVSPILAPGEPRYRQECWQEPVRYVSREPVYEPRYERRGMSPGASAVVGGVIGAAVGRQFGDGDGRRAATVAGAVIGSAIGAERARDRYETGYGYGPRSVEREVVQYENRCRTVPDGYVEDRVVGYRVDYVYHGHTYTTETPYHPGSTIRVRVDVTPEV